VGPRLTTQGKDFYQHGIEMLISRYDKCLNCGEDYVEKQLNGSAGLIRFGNKKPKTQAS
jgi:hypothetical protein